MMVYENQRHDAMFERMFPNMSRQPSTNIYVPDFDRNIQYFVREDCSGKTERYAIELVKSSW